MIGLIVGVVLTFTSSIYAEDLAKLVGKQVDGEFPVVLDGRELKNKAPAIEGTSYAPVREIAETLGLGVDFKDGTVLLTTPKQSEVPKLPEEELTIEVIESRLEGLKSELGVYEWQLEALKKTNPDKVSATESVITETKSKIADLEKQKEELSK